jgi:hypothetical protein
MYHLSRFYVYFIQLHIIVTKVISLEHGKYF